MTSSAPSVSVLLPAYDAAEHLDAAVGDLLAQTFADFELVAVDDGSRDATGEILERYAACDGRVVVVHNDRNIGLAPSLNRGLEHCRAPLVARADADDRYHPDRLLRQVSYLRAHPQVGVLSCSFERINGAGAPLRTVHLPTEDRQIRVRELFLNSIFHPGVVFRTDLVRGLGGYDPTFLREDDELFARLLQHTRVANLPDALVRYRIVDGSMSHSKLVEREAEAPVIRQPMLSDYLDRDVSIEEARAMVHTFLPPGSHLVPLAELRDGERGFQEVLQAVRKKEDARTVRFFRGEVARAWLRQARRWSEADPALNRFAVGRAVRWWPPVIARKRSLRVALRRPQMSVLPVGTHAHR
jgi:cellulose synthase/poly-beta-1,6-N-acetylglucosamine synthase-like glycosyltransferase